MGRKKQRAKSGLIVKKYNNKISSEDLLFEIIKLYLDKGHDKIKTVGGRNILL